MIKYIFIFILIWKLQYSNVIKYANKYALRWRVDKRLVMAIIQVESMGKIRGISHKGAIGVMGVMPIQARDYYKYRYKKTGNRKYIILKNAPEKFLRGILKNPQWNINIGCYALRRYLDVTKSGDQPRGNYIKTINMYMNGYKRRVSWKYINDVMGYIVSLK